MSATGFEQPTIAVSATGATARTPRPASIMFCNSTAVYAVSREDAALGTPAEHNRTQNIEAAASTADLCAGATAPFRREQPRGRPPSNWCLWAFALVAMQRWRAAANCCFQHPCLQPRRSLLAIRCALLLDRRSTPGAAVTGRWMFRLPTSTGGCSSSASAASRACGARG
jgi:hypothetical protein